MEKWITVKDMYDYAVDNNLYLLSQFNDTFWDDYKNNHATYDKLFKRLYKNFRYFDQDIDDEDLSVEDVTNEFIDEVYNHLMVNKKKYDELYRVASLNDSDYDYLSNIKYQETRQDTGSADRTINSGARSDTTNNTEGAREDTSEEQVSAFNESTYTNANKTTDNKGSETDTSTYSKGAETDTDNLATTGNSTINRSGLISKDSMSDLVKKHLNVWGKYEFYAMIFGDIAKALLLV